nr:thermostable beta-glucosidase b [Quercus suber]
MLPRRYPVEAEVGQSCFQFKDAIKAIQNGTTLEKAAAKLAAQLTDQERLDLLDGDEDFFPGIARLLQDGYNVTPYILGEIKRLGIPGIRFADGPRGCVIGRSTTFPVAMARGATWDIGLEERVGRAIGLEARAQGANYFGGVCVNLPRHPAWGRIQETYGEEPVQLGAFGAALTKGVQENVMACVKHFALNSMENARFQVNVHIEEAALRETYLAHFQYIVEAGVKSVMSSYNSVNGEWAGQNKHLLLDILRHEWKFDGFVMSDFLYGIRDGPLSIKNGLDVEAPFRNLRARQVSQALENHRLTWSDIDRAGKAILQTQLRFFASCGSAEPDPTVVFSKEHRDLSREVATRSIVLLKNEHKVSKQAILPLDPSKLSNIAIIGRLADTINTGDRGSSAVRSPSITTPYEGFKNVLSESQVHLDTSDDVHSATKFATRADAAVVIVGYDYRDEGEFILPTFESNPELLEMLPSPDGSAAAQKVASFRKEHESAAKENQGVSSTGMGLGGDRKSLRLRSRDVEIIKAVAQANDRIVVCIVAAGAVIMEEWRHDVPAIMLAWYSGCEGGSALADVVIGRANVSGRLPFSIPQSEEHLPFFDRDATSITYDNWHGQRLLDRLQVEPAYPLGYGLSYSTFRLHKACVEGGQTAETIMVTATVSNTGMRPGRYVVQVYGSCSLPEEPALRVLLGFSTLDLDADDIPTAARFEVSLREIQRWTNGDFKFPCLTARIEVGGYAGDPQRVVLQHSVGSTREKV